MTRSNVVGVILAMTGWLVVPLSSAPPIAAVEAAIAPTVAAAWRHPVDAPIVDYFRPPRSRYGPGNRGLEYGTKRGQRVGAVAPGEVVFAGQVGGRRFVVVAHSPTLRSTYAYLAAIEVAVGQSVVAGERVATADTGFHLTARLHGVYVDPLLYLGADWSVRLVALPHGSQQGGPR